MAQRSKKPMRDHVAAAVAALRTFALTFPESTEEFPWGERAIKVRGKVFLFLSKQADGLHLSVKLPVSAASALELPFAEPTGYGLGKHGWVTAILPPDESVPLGLLREWVDESFRAVAAKAVLAKLEVGESGAPAAPARKKRAK